MLINYCEGKAWKLKDRYFLMSSQLLCTIKTMAIQNNRLGTNNLLGYPKAFATNADKGIRISTPESSPAPENTKGIGSKENNKTSITDQFFLICITMRLLYFCQKNIPTKRAKTK